MVEKVEKVKKVKKIMIEKGIMLKTSRVSYFFNYILAVLLVLLFLLLLPYVSLDFTFFPKTANQLWTTMFVFGFVILIIYLLDEPGLERFIRQYIVTNNETIKVEGILTKKRLIIPHQSVSDIRVEKSILGRIFNFGNVNVVGYKNEIKMKGIKEPDVVYRIIENKIALMSGTRAKRERVVEEERVEKEKVKKKEKVKVKKSKVGKK